MDRWMATEDGPCFLAIRPIPRGELLTFSYMEGERLVCSTNVRQHYLHQSRAFICGCSRCSAPDRCRPMICPSCTDGILMRTGKVHNLGPIVGDGSNSVISWTCDVCRHACSDDDLGDHFNTEKTLLRTINDLTLQKVKMLLMQAMIVCSSFFSYRTPPPHYSLC